MLGNREEAEEATQDIFMRVHRGISDFRRESDIRTWLYTITVNTCLTRLRRKVPEQVHPDADNRESEKEWDAITSDDNPEKLLIEQDTKNLLVKALELIPPDEKEILLLFYIDELKYNEIATVLNIPLGTVCTQIYRARRKLRVAMKVIQKELAG